MKKTSSAGVTDERRMLTLEELGRSVFERLRAMSHDGVGISRETYGPGEQAAMELMKTIADEEGLETQWDDVGNLVVSVQGEEPGKPFIICGSHLDSVPQGGNFDGAAGVVAGLLALIRLKRSGIKPPRTVKLYAIRGEESAWYGKTYIGSSALFGGVTADDLRLLHRDGTRTLREAMLACNVAVDKIERGEVLLRPDQVAAYFELHIEQGPVLVARSLPTAIVTGIRGNVRHKRVLCRGEAGHSGAVPRWLRRDAVFAIADLTMRLDEHWRVLQEQGLDLVVTIGMLGTNPAEHSMSRIPGEAWFSLEIRSQSSDTLEAFYHLMRTECRAIEKSRGVTFEFDRRVDAKPARMDEKLIGRLKGHSAALGLPVETVPSGAGHDAAVFANAGIPSAMIFIRNEHGSHNPAEAMDYDDFTKGAELLCHALCDKF